MAFPFDPLWKGLGLEANEELPAPESFGSDFDNSIKKRVSFAQVVSEDEDDTRKKKQVWKSWRRKSRNSYKPQKKEVKNKPAIVTEKFPDEPGDSFDSFEARAMDQRDEHLDGDFWDESDRDQDSDTRTDVTPNEVPSLWSTLFNFGDEEKDFEDGWTEGGSTFFSDTEAASLNSSFSEDATSGSIRSSSEADGEGEEVELTKEAVKTLDKTKKGPTNADIIRSNDNALSGTELNKEQRDEVSRSSNTPVEVDSDHDFWISAAAKNCIIPVKVEQESNGTKVEIADDTEQPVVVSEALDKSVKSSDDKRKKKKTRWLVGRGRVDKNRAHEPPKKATDTTSAQSEALGPVPEEQREVVGPSRKVSYNVDDGDSGLAHKSCVPSLALRLHERKKRNKEPIGKLLCQSQRPSYFSQPSAVSVNSDLTSQATSLASEPIHVVRIVSDTQGNQGPVVGSAKSGHSDIQQQMQLEESHFATASGPQSLYSYEYGTGQHAVVRYTHFGDDPEEVMSVREYDFPLTVFPDSDDVVVMIEV